jgi:hypothetical protein
MDNTSIVIRGAREHNLRNVNLDLCVPKMPSWQTGSLWVPKTSSAGRIHTTRAGCDVRERAYATRV